MFKKSTYILSIIFSFVLFFLICPNQVSAQTTVNFSLVILPAPEVKEEVIPEKVEKVEKITVEPKQIENTAKQEELILNDNQQTSGFGALLEKNSGIENKSEIISNTTDEKQTENIRAGPS